MDGWREGEAHLSIPSNEHVSLMLRRGERVRESGRGKEGVREGWMDGWREGEAHLSSSEFSNSSTWRIFCGCDDSSQRVQVNA